MQEQQTFRRDMVKVFVYPVLALFLLPAFTLWFAAHVTQHYDAMAVQSFEQSIAADATADAGRKAAAVEFFRAHPPSSTCFDSDPRLDSYRAEVCPRYSMFWQFSLAKLASIATLLIGAGALLAIGLLGAAAFRSRAAQYRSLVIGWRLLTLLSAYEVIVQGTALVWLSFWVTAYFFEIYILKLILIAAVLAGAAILAAVGAIFRKPKMEHAIDGELIEPETSPLLWQRVRALAQQVGTAPPDHIVAGIDTNFFVTESPLKSAGRDLTGRILFVSIPLLRQLDREEADAVLAHELAHLQGGDTASSAMLGPKLVQFDHYCEMMRQGGLTLLVYYVMMMYRVILEFAMKRDSREREFRADRTAAGLISPRAIVQSLVKIAAYANYRGEVERKLYEHKEQHQQALGIAGSISAGLAPYAASAQFLEAMKSANVPHPFDSHPALPERMANVNHVLEEQAFPPLLTQAPADSWANDIGAAQEIEQRLWDGYERAFSGMHEQKLAWTYEPANDAERAVVLKYFPPVSITLKKDQQVTISIDGLQLPEKPLIGWDAVSELKYEDGFGGDKLEVVHPEKGLVGNKSTKVTLYGIKPQREQFKAALGAFWQRHKVMRAQQQEAMTQA